ncbi:MAG: peptide chain release factor N(5)-glutamine methyltransferase [Cyclobacteriaceae bacterium]
MKKMFARQLQQTLSRQILEGRSDIYNEQEAQQIAQILLEYFLHLTHNDILLNKQKEINLQDEYQLNTAISRLLKDEPVQYITGEAYFYGRPFYVSPSVLIPRRETEELTHLIISENKKSGLHVLDIGTGSGCIAITLAKELHQSHVHALDVSTEALAVAKANARRHQAELGWHLNNVLQDTPLPEMPIDIVVSNPPYVRESEAAEMQNNVLAYEPATALFVSDENPLIYYEQIIKMCLNSGFLSADAKVYFEINEFLGEQMMELFDRYNMQNTVLQRDMQEKNRFIKANFPN